MSAALTDALWLWLCCLVEKTLFHSLVDCVSVSWRSPFQYDWCQGSACWACWRKSDLRILSNSFWNSALAASVALSAKPLLLFFAVGCCCECCGPKCIVNPQNERDILLIYSQRPNTPFSTCINTSTLASNNQDWSSSTHPSLKTFHHPSQSGVAEVVEKKLIECQLQPSTQRTVPLCLWKMQLLYHQQHEPKAFIHINQTPIPYRPSLFQFHTPQNYLPLWHCFSFFYSFTHKLYSYIYSNCSVYPVYIYIQFSQQH